MALLKKQDKSWILAINSATEDVGDWHFVKCFYCKVEGVGQEKLPESPHCPFAWWSVDALSLHWLQLSFQAHSVLCST